MEWIAFWRLLDQFAGRLPGKQARDLNQRSCCRTKTGSLRVRTILCHCRDLASPADAR